MHLVFIERFSRGSGAIDGWQRTSRQPSTPHALLYAGHAARASDRSCLMAFDTDFLAEKNLYDIARGAVESGDAYVHKVIAAP